MSVDVHKGHWPVAAERSETAGRARISKGLVLVACAVSLAGLLFGYDQGVIGGALTGIKSSLHTSTFVSEIITSWVTLGALVGALIAGGLADEYGRRLAILVGAATFTLGVVIETIAPSTFILVGGRLILGFGVGVASVAAPLYAAEVAPTHLRGRFVSIYQLAITFGVFIAYVVDQLLASHDWRVMLGLSVVPGVLLVFGMLPLPDSPTWYVRAHKDKKAAEAFRQLRPSEDADAEVAAAEKSIGASKSATWSEVFTRRWRKPLIVGVGLATLQQLTGINAIIYYADNVFAAAGFHTLAEQKAATTWSIGAVNILFTFVAVLYVDRLGRRPLLLSGLVGMGASLIAVGFCFLHMQPIAGAKASASNHPTDAGIYTLVAVVVFIASFAFSLGPVVWTVINEIFPSSVRGRCVAVATGANWFATWIVSQLFLSLTKMIGEPGTFWMFAGICGIAFLFVWRLVPETKGKSLAQIQEMWA